MSSPTQFKMCVTCSPVAKGLDIGINYKCECNDCESIGSWKTFEEDEEDEDEEDEPTVQGIKVRNLEPEFESALTLNNECCICMDDIGVNNCTTTECGHTFHATCLFRNMFMRIECPMCRKELVEVPDEDEDEDEEYEEDEDQEEDEEEDEEEDDDQEEGEDQANPPSTLTCKQMAEKLTSMGYTMTDLLFFAVGHVHESESATLNDELDEKMSDIVDKMMSGEIAVLDPTVQTAVAEPKSPRRRHALPIDQIVFKVTNDAIEE